MDAGTVGPAAATAGGPAPDRLLDLVWRRHRQWSVAADAARRRLNRWRLWNLVLLVVGAVTGALAAQTGLAARTATWWAVVAAVSLGLAGFLQAHLLTTGQTARWARARAASEALKAETHRYLLRVAPYAGADRAQVLQAQLDLVGARAAALLVDAQNVPVDDRPLPAVRTVEEYVTARARGQAAWHRDRSRRHARRAGRLRAWRLRAWQLAATGLMAWSGAGRHPGAGAWSWRARATRAAATSTPTTGSRCPSPRQPTARSRSAPWGSSGGLRVAPFSNTSRR